MKLGHSRQISEKYSNIKSHENPSSGSRVIAYVRTYVRTYGRTDTKKISVVFRNFTKAPKIVTQINIRRRESAGEWGSSGFIWLQWQ